VISDGSSDGTIEMISQEVESISLIEGKGDWWWAGSLQQGYDWIVSHNSDPDQIALIMNDDTEFEPDFLERGLSILACVDRTLLLATCYDRKNQRLVDAGVHVDWKRLHFRQASEPGEINCLSTRGLFIRIKDFVEIGGFHPKLLPHYTSDYEFSTRAYRKGMSLITDPSLRLFVDTESTGFDPCDSDPFFLTLGKLFSKKSPVNPIVWTCFVALSCPWKWKVQNCLRIWRNAMRQVIRSFHLSDN
jgi:GT2 family glycosyltransferase